MTWHAPDIDDPQQAKRIHAAMMAAARIKQDALRTNLGQLGRFETLLVTKPVDMMDGADFIALNRMAWAYRRQLPADVRASLSIASDDPIMRDRASAAGACGQSASERALTDG